MKSDRLRALQSFFGSSATSSLGPDAIEIALAIAARGSMLEREIADAVAKPAEAVRNALDALQSLKLISVEPGSGGSRVELTSTGHEVVNTLQS
jgi:hypothetical protein